MSSTSLNQQPNVHKQFEVHLPGNANLLKFELKRTLQYSSVKTTFNAMEDMQRAVKIFVEENKLNTSATARTLDLCSEVGEVAKLNFNEELGKVVSPELWEEELGDVLFSTLTLFNSRNLDAEASLKKVIDKYRRRLLQKGSPDSGR